MASVFLRLEVFAAFHLCSVIRAFLFGYRLGDYKGIRAQKKQQHQARYQISGRGQNKRP
ncbi:hypothetical protein D3C78_1910150 [compost metagenome]